MNGDIEKGGAPGPDPIIEISEIGDCIRIEYRDLISFEKQMRLVDMIFDLYAKRKKSKFIVNTKGCPIEYSIVERYQVGAYLAEKFKSHVAIAYIIDKRNLTGIAENAAQNRGGTRIKIVTTEEDALAWVRSSEDEEKSFGNGP
jgi:hypothetical protein